MPETVDEQYSQALRLAQEGHYPEATALYEQLASTAHDSGLQTRIYNDLGALEAVEGDLETARQRFELALEVDSEFHPARTNLSLIRSDPDFDQKSRPHRNTPAQRADTPKDARQNRQTTKVAILSFLFNWPSTGGGIIHTVELAKFLTQAGYEVQLLHPRFPGWGIGKLESDPPFPVTTLEFTPQEWTIAGIKAKFRAAVETFSPDHVIITDCWNFKPHLAEVMQGYSCFLRMQAQECLCPLNNLRLLPAEEGGLRQCDKHQLGFAEECFQCLCRFGNSSGVLHQLERRLSAVGAPEYDAVLRKSLQQAAAVLVLNPQVAELFRPYCRRVAVVTWGMDQQRFGWPVQKLPESHPAARRDPEVKRILFAGLAEEPIKGFSVLLQACAQLWQRRQDFELVATCDRPEQEKETPGFLRYVGWQSQQDLPDWYRGSDLCVVPTIAQEGLSRTSVEAMACGIPVIGSRIGGLPFSVSHGRTGLLCTPGDVAEWAESIARLLDDAQLRESMGRAGRKEFEERFTWEQVIERHYQPLLGAPQRTAWHS